MEAYVFGFAIVLGTFGIGVVILDSVFRYVDRSHRYRYRYAQRARERAAIVVFAVVTLLTLLAVATTSYGG